MTGRTAVDLEDLSAAVAKAIADRQIGRPVSVRMHVFQTQVGPKPSSEDIIAKVSGWFCSPLDNVKSLQAGQNHSILLGRFRDGETMLLTCTATSSAQPSYDLLVLGTQGSIRFDNAVGI